MSAYTLAYTKAVKAMRMVAVKYLSQDKRNGRYIYRRRVPEGVRDMVGKGEFLKALGATMEEAIVAYGRFHGEVERVVQLGRHGVTQLSPREQQEAMAALLRSWEADPHSPGLTDNERTWRDEAAMKLVEPYQDDRTGDYVGVPEDNAVLASALLSGVPKEAPKPTLTDAFKFYLSENAKDLPEQNKKQQQRFGRAEKNLIAAINADKQVSELTREDARMWRDLRESQGAAPATIQREKNDICAVINFANSELDAGYDNPFSKLKMPKARGSRQNDRDSLPQAVIDGVYLELLPNPELHQIWTLLHFTGARPSEVRMLLREEVVLDHAVPHIVIQERDDRTLKTSWSNRKIPLVGDALSAAQEALNRPSDSTHAFPHYASEGGMDRLSNALNKRIRNRTDNTKHVTYSLRHNMTDRMRQAEIFEDTARAIEGHAYGKGQHASYGGEVSLEQKRQALLKVNGLE